MSGSSLEQNLERLAEELEDRPDPWFKTPKGYLKKPPFGHERSNMLKSMLGSGIKRRWFVLNYSEKLLKYYESDEPKAQLKGTIDLSIVESVQMSEDTSLPEFSLELISQDKTKNYVISAESFPNMVRWAFAINMAISKTYGEAATVEIGIDDLNLKDSALKVVASRWLEYDVQYEGDGSLMMNVAGYVNRDKDGNFLCNLVAVTSFQYHPDGTPGVSELSGAIRIKDYLIKVNDIDLLNISFAEALEVITNTPCPKTLRFCRDNAIAGDALRQDGWAYVFYPALNRRRKRYLELDYDVLNFKKIEPSGSASSRRDAYFNIRQVLSIRPLIDKTVPVDQQFTLILACSPSAVINHVDQDEVSQGGSYVNTLELCFSTLQTMNLWRYALSLPLTLSDGTEISIAVLPEETVEHVDTNPVQAMNRLAIKDEVTGFFAPRVFSIVKGSLTWKRLLEGARSSSQSSALVRTRSLFIANASRCDLTSLRLIKDPKKEVSGYEYQLVIETIQRSVTMGMNDAKTLSQWAATLSDLALVAPPETRQYFKPPETIEVVHLGNVGALQVLTDDDPNASSRSMRLKSVTTLLVQHGGKIHHEGYLYFKHDKSVFNLSGGDGFRRYWFSLYSTDFVYSKSKADGVKKPVGSIDLKEVYAVKEPNDESAPENAFELVTANRTFTLVAESEADQISWIDTVGDRLEERKAAAREDAFELATHLPRPQKIDAMKRATQFSGILIKKMNNGSWKERFFVLANRKFTST